MKKNYIKIIAAAAIALLFASCQVNETDIQGNNPDFGKNTIAFSVGGVDTRSAVAISDISEKGATIHLGTDEMGNNFYLEETVIDLNSPVTRGTPAYTENVVTLYNKQMFVHSRLGDDTYGYDEDSKCYVKSYGRNIWDEADTINFWMHMPVALGSYGVTAGPTFAGLGPESQTISFSYESPATAAEQADIIFAARSIGEEEYEDNGNKMDVLFQHALTGVKFAIGNDDDDIADNGISISKITFTGLIDNGTCVVTPTKEAGKYRDSISIHSSYAEGVVVWTPNSTPVHADGIYSEFGAADTVSFVGESFTDKGGYPASFAQKGNKKNLNDGNASKTFWLVPQTMTDNVKLTINYSFGDKNDYEWTIDFGKALKDVVWKPGQLRTYTIRIDEVNVQIDDEVHIVQAPDYEVSYTPPTGSTVTVTLPSYQGSTKDNVKITNTGNTDAYIRAAIVGQWLDEEGNPVFGFTDYTAGRVVLVDSWYQDQFVTKPEEDKPRQKQGTFTGLPGSNWEKGVDGYYYYKNIVPAGQEVPDDLFESYEVGEVPGVAVAGRAPKIYFRMEIATQAISAKKQDGTDYKPYTAAWENANSQK